MVVAIVIGNFAGAFVASAIGMTGGLLGTFIVGLVIYAVFCLLTGTSMNVMQGFIFAVLVYVSGLVTAWIGSATGLAGGLIGLVLNAVVLSMLWGYFGKGKSPLGTTTRRRGRRKRRR